MRQLKRSVHTTGHRITDLATLLGRQVQEPGGNLSLFTGPSNLWPQRSDQMGAMHAVSTPSWKINTLPSNSPRNWTNIRPRLPQMCYGYITATLQQTSCSSKRHNWDHVIPPPPGGGGGGVGSDPPRFFRNNFFIYFFFNIL